jgi:uncharacterized membrane protein YkvA (DUF1232 family)
MRVPGPPRGRRRPVAGDLWQRVDVMRASESDGATAAGLLTFAWDVILLVKDLALDPRVSRRDKAVAAAAVAYLLLPVDVVPDPLPVLGQIDDLGIVALALRRLLNAAGFDVLYELWRGSDEGLALVLALAGVEN